MGSPRVSHVVAICLPLVLTALGGLRRNAYEPQSGLFASQKWGYADVLLVLAEWTGTGFVSILIPRETLDRLPVAWQAALLFLIQGVIVLGTMYAILKWRYQVPLSTLGLRIRHARHDVAWALKIVSLAVVGPASLALLSASTQAVVLSVPGLPTPGSNLAALLQQRPVDLMSALILGIDYCILGPLMEETVFRALLYCPAARKYGPMGATVVAGVLWAMAHADKPFTLMYLLLVGPLYVYLYRRTESLFCSLTFHISANTIAGAVKVLGQFSNSQAFILPALFFSLGLWLVCRRTAPRLRRTDDVWVGIS